MKNTSKIFLFAILLGIALLNTTCGDKRAFAKVTLEGYVYDSLGGKPVSGIWVILYACESGQQKDECQSYLVGQAQTDVSGRFYIHDDAARSGRYAILINGRGPYGFTGLCDADWLKQNFSKIYLNKL